MTICTIDVHSRDVVGKLISSKIESVLAFMWQSQLRHRSVKSTTGCTLGLVKLTLELTNGTVREQIEILALMKFESNKFKPNQPLVLVNCRCRSETQVGRGREGLLRQHLRRRVPLLVRVPGKHLQARHHTPHRQMLHHAHSGIDTG